jgi:hypothetical protein
VLDATAIILLPLLARALGASTGAGLFAAFLYAFLPMAVTYGSIANLDPVMAPLVVLLVWLLAPPEAGRWRWIALGGVTAALIATKETALVALAVVPIAAWLRCKDAFAGLAIWGAVTLLGSALLLDLPGYAGRVLSPGIPGSSIELEPFERLVGNVRLFLDASSHGWLGFGRHGRPLAPLLARLHHVVNPVFVVACLAAFLAAAARRDRSALVLLYLPVLAIIAFLPSDSAVPRRMHLVVPLLCLGIACEIARLPRRGRIVAALAAVSIGLSGLLPQRLLGQRVDLAGLIFANPGLESVQPTGYYKPWEHRPLVLVVPREGVIEGSLWLSPGTYRARAFTDGRVDVSIDGQPVGSERATMVSLQGWRHDLLISSPGGAVVRSVELRVPKQPKPRPRKETPRGEGSGAARRSEEIPHQRE